MVDNSLYHSYYLPSFRIQNVYPDCLNCIQLIKDCHAPTFSGSPFIFYRTVAFNFCLGHVTLLKASILDGLHLRVQSFNVGPLNLCQNKAVQAVGP